MYAIRSYYAYGWQVIPAIDGHDPDALAAAIAEAQADVDHPSLICCRTTIGFGSPNKAGSHDCHGAPLGQDEIALVRERLGWPHAPFAIPDACYQAWDAKAKGQAAQAQWQAQFAAYRGAYPELAAELLRRQAGSYNFV